MTKEKISSQEIIDLVASKAAVSKRAAEEFLKVMIATIEEALIAGEVVKIKGFGTFKLQWNEPRKSVNVQTGEEIILDGYYKVAFAPEASLKELVNEPFAHLEPVQLDDDNNFILSEKEDDVVLDPLRIFTEQASEIKDLLSEIQALSAPLKPVAQIEEPVYDYFENDNGFEESDDLGFQLDLSEAVEAFEAIQEINVAQDKDELTPQFETEILPEIQTIPEILPEIEREFEPEPEITIPEIVVPEMMESEQLEKPERQEVFLIDIKDEKPDLIETVVSNSPEKTVVEFESTPFLTGVAPIKNRKRWLWIPAVGLLLAIVMGLYLFYAPVNQFGNKLFENTQAELTYVKENVNIPDMVNSVSEWFKTKPQKVPVPETVVIPKDTAVHETTEVKEPVDTLTLLETPRTYNEFIATEQVEQGMRLANMSEKYYGSKDFWVYIYEANIERIKNPDNIQIGTLIRVPKLDSRLIDASNPRCVKKARNLHDEYVNRKAVK